MLPGSTMIVLAPALVEPGPEPVAPPEPGMLEAPAPSGPLRTVADCGALALHANDSPSAAQSAATEPAQDRYCVVEHVMKPRDRDALCVC
jgi:hypothetical protein